MKANCSFVHCTDVTYDFPASLVLLTLDRRIPFLLPANRDGWERGGVHTKLVYPCRILAGCSVDFPFASNFDDALSSCVAVDFLVDFSGSRSSFSRVSPSG